MANKIIVLAGPDEGRVFELGKEAMSAMSGNGAT
jgi:hypothetical protein